MTQLLRVLLVEDRKEDASLLLRDVALKPLTMESLSRAIRRALEPVGSPLSRRTGEA